MFSRFSLWRHQLTNLEQEEPVFKGPCTDELCGKSSLDLNAVQLKSILLK